MENFSVTYGNHQHHSAYKSVQQLLDFLYENQQFSYAGFVEFKDGLKIKGVMNESHFIQVYGRHAKRCFFVGRGQDTWNGIFNFGGRNWGNADPIPMLNPDNLNSETMNILPKPSC